MQKPYERYLQEVLIDSKTLQARVAELGRKISADYATTPNVLLICILKVGVMFLSYLMRHLDFPHSIDFMAIASYGSGARESSGRVRIDMDLRQDIAASIIVVEDIGEQRHNAQYILTSATREPASVRVCTLLTNPAAPRHIDSGLRRSRSRQVLFGYGLTWTIHFRNLPFIGVCKPNSRVGLRSALVPSHRTPSALAANRRASSGAAARRASLYRGRGRARRLPAAPPQRPRPGRPVRWPAAGATDRRCLERRVLSARCAAGRGTRPDHLAG